MNFTIKEIPASQLDQYAAVPMRYETSVIYDVVEGMKGFQLEERKLDAPYQKDYDALAGEGPLAWGKQFDLTNWGFLVVESDGKVVGGAAMVFDTPEVNMLEGRTDIAVLWDIRVAADYQGMGIGKALFAVVEAWARERNCRELKIETQNTNIAACRFYAQQGCELRVVNREAYPEMMEIQLLWYKEL